ncbi:MULTISPECIES: AAWKG family protein [Streptomyces]|uniref:AAWKG family protein n=1 Tax=Streptomyces TaxID=1883 RepID=UPI00240E4C0A|nr:MULTISPECIES: AAWKG family protein [Streptomyces]WFB88503.1 AAWKG family protein [Streptomyces olivaceus]WGK50945.1 AAWKG family protein [Streptomyces sp. B146]
MPADNWEHIINLMTGWTLPERTEVVDQKGGGGIQWLDVKISNVSLHTVEGAGNVIGPSSSVFHFYEADSKVPSFVRGKRVDVTYTGIELGKEFWVRGSAALDLLLASYSTEGAHGAGAPAAGQGVDLRTFTAAAKSFDAAGDFFAQRTEIIKQWLEAMGSENAAWKGTAADVFRLLLERMHDKYENYTAQLRPPGFAASSTSPSTSYASTTLHGDSLLTTEQALYQAYQKLFDAHFKFYWRTGQQISYEKADGSAASGNYPADPRDILIEMMVDIGNFIVTYNFSQVSGGALGRPVVGSAFSDTPKWGRLSDMSTWSAVGNEATRRWTYNVAYNLDPPARQVVTETAQVLSRQLDPEWNTRFAFAGKETGSIADEIRTEQAAKQARETAENQEKYNKQLENLGNNFTNGINNAGKNITDGINNAGKNFGENLGGIGENFGKGLDGFTENLGKNLDGLFGNQGGTGDGLGPGAQNLNLPEGQTRTTGLNGNNSAGTPEIPSFGGSNGSDGQSLELPEGQSTLDPQSLLSTDPTGFSPSGSEGSPNGTGQSFTLPEGQTSVLPDSPAGNSALGLAGLGAGDGTTRNDGRRTFPNGLVQTTSPDGGTSFTLPEGGSVMVGDDGSLSTTFPDGTVTTTLPDGTVTTTLPDGQTQVSELDPGQTLTNPDGSTTQLGQDGSLTTTLPDGSSFTVGPDGSSTVEMPDGSSTQTFPNGLVQTTSPDGGTSFTLPEGGSVMVGDDGSLSTTFPDGTVTTTLPDGTVTTTLPDGQTQVSELDPGQTLTNPDGSTTQLGQDGSLTTTLPDGSSFTVGPDGSISTAGTGGNQDSPATTLPPGSLTSDGPGLSLPSGGTTTLPGTEGVQTFPDGTTAVTGPDGFTTTTFPDGSSTVSGPNGEFQALPSRTGAEALPLPDGAEAVSVPDATAATGPEAAAASAAAGLGAPAAGASTGGSADPGLMNMMSPMMMMMGMSRAGQQQQNGSQERVRDVYQDGEADGAFVTPYSEHRGARPADEDLYEEEEEDSPELLNRPETDSRTGYPSRPRPATQNSWRGDEQDAWGTTGEGLPASLGR